MSLLLGVGNSKALGMFLARPNGVREFNSHTSKRNYRSLVSMMSFRDYFFSYRWLLLDIIKDSQCIVSVNA